jgi:hypothetical protein
MRVLYSASFSKLIAPMDSPRLELSNNILFVIFHRRLTLFSFSTCFSVKKNCVQQREKSQQQGRRSFFLLGGAHQH